VDTGLEKQEPKQQQQQQHLTLIARIMVDRVCEKERMVSFILNGNTNLHGEYSYGERKRISKRRLSVSEESTKSKEEEKKGKKYIGEQSPIFSVELTAAVYSVQRCLLIATGLSSLGARLLSAELSGRKRCATNRTWSMLTLDDIDAFETIPTRIFVLPLEYLIIL
jgi:hypothetical protein